jgi:hypothetical protein
MKKQLFLVFGLVVCGVMSPLSASYRRTPSCLMILGPDFLERSEFGCEYADDAKGMTFEGLLMRLQLADSKYAKSEYNPQRIRSVYPEYIACELQTYPKWEKQARAMVIRNRGQLPIVEKALKELDERN